jgi:DnaJ-class molecular chaperone
VLGVRIRSGHETIGLSNMSRPRTRSVSAGFFCRVPNLLSLPGKRRDYHFSLQRVPWRRKSQTEEETRLRIEQGGEAGDGAGLNGDLYVVIRVAKHHFFERQDNNLFCEVSISFSQAALGTVIEVPGLDHQVMELKIPAGTQSAEVFKLRGRGIKGLYSHRNGDLYVKVVVKTPQSLTKEERNLLRRLAELRGEDLNKTDRSLISKLKNRIH